MFNIRHPWLKAFISRKKWLLAEKEGWGEFARLTATLAQAQAQVIEEHKLLVGKAKQATTTMCMLNTRLAVRAERPELESCVIDAGGTQLRIYRVKYTLRANGDKPGYALSVHPMVKTAMPGTDGQEVTPEAFLNKITQYLLPLLAKNGKRSDENGAEMPIKFSFSYPVEVDADNDVRPIAFTKDIKAQQLINFPLRRALRESLLRAGVDKVGDITILNDTVAVYSAGILASRGYGLETLDTPADEAFSTSSALAGQEGISIQNAGLPLKNSPKQAVLGVVYGTGFNICYEEIWRSAATWERSLFNTEIGCYNGLPKTAIDNNVDSCSDNPGEGLAEKRISGVYLGRLFKEAILAVIDDLQATPHLAQDAAVVPLTTIKVAQWAQQWRHQDNTPPNIAWSRFLTSGKLAILDQLLLPVVTQQLLQEVVRVITWRSAYYAALLTAGVAKRVAAQRKINELVISLEGGLIINFPKLYEYYAACLRAWLLPYRINVQLFLIKDAVPVGAAALYGESLARARG